MKTRLPLYFLSLPVLAAGWIFAGFLLRGPLTAEQIIELDLAKPFSFRVLIPLGARALAGIGLSPWLSIALLVSASALGLFFACYYLARVSGVSAEPAPLLAFLASVGTYLFILSDGKVYDLATAGFFALSLGLLERRKLLPYFILFPLITLNRETSFLLILFFAVFFWRKLPLSHYLLGLAYQAGIFGAIRILLSSALADRPGLPFWIRPLEIFAEYSARPLASFSLIFCALFIIYILSRNWEKKPAFLRIALLTMGPALLLLHLIAGMAFELRVFAELAPAVFFLAVLPLRPSPIQE
jgi:hypothetical protein